MNSNYSIGHTTRRGIDLFFDRFPLIRYDINKDGNRKLATDILTRIAFREQVQKQGLAFQDYYVEDGMTPELVAEDLYGDAELHWIVLMFNDMIDPFHDWPLSENQIEDYLDKKYPGMALYVGLTAPNFVVGTELTYDTTQRAVIGSWDSTTRRLSIYNESTPFGVTAAVGKVLISQDKDGITFNTPITRAVAFQRLGLHHFENPGGTAELNGYAAPPEGSSEHQTVAGQTGAFGTYASSAATLANTLIDNYIYSDSTGIDSTHRVVSIHEDFQTKNEAKRDIKVLQPRYVDAVVSQFAKMMSESK